MAAIEKNCGHRNLRTYVLIVLGAGILACGIAVFEMRSEENYELHLPRNPAGEGKLQLSFGIDAEDLLDSYPYTIQVEEQRLTEKERMELFRRAGEELEERILGKNESLDHVTRDLFLPEVLQDGLVQASLRFDNYEVLDSRGRILWENFKEESYVVKVISELICQDELAFYEFYLRLTSEGLGEEDKLLISISELLQAENQKEGSEILTLPEIVNGHKLSWQPASERLSWRIFLLGVVGAASLYVYRRNEKKKKEKARIEALSLDYPNILGQLSLLASAGMTVATAWKKIVGVYQMQKEKGFSKERPGYEEMLKTLYEMQDGIGESKAYERFGNRCGLPMYRKLASLLVQNIRKGPAGMQKLLDAETAAAFTQRKLKAKQLGEEAGTKLLLPMGLMLILVFIILLVPAGIAL